MIVTMLHELDACMIEFEFCGDEQGLSIVSLKNDSG
jgi:hypothetical protein